MKYVLDTNVISALMRNEAWVIERLSRETPDQLAVPQPVFSELVFGVARLPASRRKTALVAQLARVRAVLPALAWTDEVTDEFGRIKAALQRRGTPLEDFDVAIAAHALAYGAKLASANIKHLARVPQLSLERWDGAGHRAS